MGRVVRPTTNRGWRRAVPVAGVATCRSLEPQSVFPFAQGHRAQLVKATRG